MPAAGAAIWIGTSGYVYRHWRGGVFYPAGLRARAELAWYADRFRTVELNNPFYRLPSSATFARWRDETPQDFTFAVKASRFISHVKRLRDTAEPLALLLEQSSALGDKLGPILVQLPPQFHLDLPRLSDFLGSLPDGYQWVLEVRHPSWQVSEVYEALGRRSVALCVPVGGRIQPDLVTTAPFTYIRFHAGAEPGGRFADDQLEPWAARIRALSRSGKQVYAYFNNDWEGHAVGDAARLRARLGLVR
ncbi:MAG TPA: DUF72 domain-containing protein [Gemmatimonadales bacterium]|nr:DUF72 domain-containing protein [Gemmatimonadales bacterium]